MHSRVPLFAHEPPPESGRVTGICCGAPGGGGVREAVDVEGRGKVEGLVLKGVLVKGGLVRLGWVYGVVLVRESYMSEYVWCLLWLLVVKLVCSGVKVV